MLAALLSLDGQEQAMAAVVDLDLLAREMIDVGDAVVLLVDRMGIVLLGCLSYEAAPCISALSEVFREGGPFESLRRMVYAKRDSIKKSWGIGDPS